MKVIGSGLRSVKRVPPPPPSGTSFRYMKSVKIRTPARPRHTAAVDGARAGRAGGRAGGGRWRAPGGIFYPVVFFIRWYFLIQYTL